MSSNSPLSWAGTSSINSAFKEQILLHVVVGFHSNFHSFLQFPLFTSSIQRYYRYDCQTHVPSVFPLLLFFPSHWNINIEFILLKSPEILMYLPCVSSQTQAIVVLRLHWPQFILHCNFAQYLLNYGNFILYEGMCFLLCSLLQADFPSSI